MTENTLEDDVRVLLRELALLEEQMTINCDYFPEEDDSFRVDNIEE